MDTYITSLPLQFLQSAFLLFVNTFSVLLHSTESANNKDITSRYEEAAALSRFLFFPPADTPSYVLSQTAHYMLPERSHSLPVQSESGRGYHAEE